MFDPFKDFEVAGYLRNVRKDKDEATIKHFEHNLFRANLDNALKYLASCEELTYQDFLNVHKILFSDYYPWAGQDRVTTLPNSAVNKGSVLFSHLEEHRGYSYKQLDVSTVCDKCKATPCVCNSVRPKLW